MENIGTSTRLCAVIGNPISHSLSPAIHNAGYEALGLNFVYVAFRVEDLKHAIEGMRALDNFRGMSVTIPHKVEAIKYLDDIADVDRSIGSINTIVNEAGTLIGLGTDGPGAMKAITDKGVEIDGKNVLILGSGGAARAISFTLARDTKLDKLAILDVNEPMLGGLVADLEAGTDAAIESGTLDNVSLGRAMDEADIIIHCTPVGMHPNDNVSLVDEDMFRPGQTVLDIVYNPLETRLLAGARLKGCKVISGVEMFINQAVLQFERFTGADAPADVMRSVVLKHLGI